MLKNVTTEDVDKYNGQRRKCKELRRKEKRKYRAMEIEKIMEEKCGN